MIQGKQDDINGERVTTDPGFPPGTGERARQRNPQSDVEGDAEPSEDDAVTAQVAPTNPGGRGYSRRTLPRLPLQRDTLPDPPERRGGGGFATRSSDPGPPVEAPADVDSLLDAFGHPKSPTRPVPQVRETAGQPSAAYHGAPHTLHARRVTLPPQPAVMLSTTDEYPITTIDEDEVPISEDIDLQDSDLRDSPRDALAQREPSLTFPEPLYTAPLSAAQTPREGELPMVETRKVDFPVVEQEPTFVPDVRINSRTKWLITFAAFGLVSVLLVAFFEARSNRAPTRSTTLTSGAWQAASGSANMSSGPTIDSPVRPARRRGDLTAAAAAQKSADSPLDDLAPSIPGDPNASPTPARGAPADRIATGDVVKSNSVASTSPAPSSVAAVSESKPPPVVEPVRTVAPAPRPAPDPPAAADYDLFKQHRK